MDKNKGTVTTQEELEELQSDPKKLMDYIQSTVREKMEEERIQLKEQARLDAQAAIDEERGRAGAVKRLPVVEEKTLDMAGGSVSAAWKGVDNLEGSYRKMAIALNDKHESFGDFLTCLHPVVQRSGVDPRLKTLSEISGDQGGFLVPEQYVNQMMMLNIEDAVIRPRAFKLPMAGESIRFPTIKDTSHASNVFGGVTGYWEKESGDIGTNDSSEPTFAQAKLTAKKLVGYTTVSNELLADSAIGLEALITQLFGKALAYFEDDAFIVGQGGGQPVGLLNADCVVEVAKETGQEATTIYYANLLKMYSRMLPTSLNRAVWLAHSDTIPQLGQMALTVGTGGSAVFITNAASGMPMSILGRPIIFTEKCQTLGTAGDIMFVDPAYYVIGDRQSLSMAASPHVKFAYDQTVYRFIQRVDGRPWLDSALTPRNGSNTVSPIVTLATRS